MRRRARATYGQAMAAVRRRFIPSISSGSVGPAVRRLRQTDGAARHLCSLLVPEEETCLSVFEARDAAAVQRANDRARFELDRIVEVQLFQPRHGGSKGEPR
jgi:hypothetical protein